jgi:hypothetical protein
LAKTVTPAGAPGGAGAACAALVMNFESFFNHLLLKDYGLAFCTYKPVAAQKAIAYTDLLPHVIILYSFLGIDVSVK